MVLAYYELSGVGSGQGHAVATSPVAGTLALPDPWMSPPTLDSLNGETRAIEVTSDARATAVRVYINAPPTAPPRRLDALRVVSGVVPGRPASAWGARTSSPGRGDLGRHLGGPADQRRPR
ncbi:MAG: hypothetical protein H6740_25225 [Alphaproteobacteria bacterium]|nr:hypothetical protein [Alphaproteobacteria bacterium]